MIPVISAFFIMDRRLRLSALIFQGGKLFWRSAHGKGENNLQIVWGAALKVNAFFRKREASGAKGNEEYEEGLFFLSAEVDARVACQLVPDGLGDLPMGFGIGVPIFERNSQLARKMLRPDGIDVEVVM